MFRTTIAASAVALLALAFSAPVRAAAVRIDNGWTLVVGSDPLELTAAVDLQAAIARRDDVHLKGPVAAAGVSAPRHAIVMGTAGDNPLVAAAAKAAPFVLDPAEPESYHAVFRDGNLYIVSASAKGAMNGVYRFDDHRTLDVGAYDVHESPRFHFRVGGHKMNQYPPPGWSEIDQARYYARHYVNVVWGEKKGPPMSLAAREKYGLGLMAEVRFPPEPEAWRNDPANAAAVYRLSDKKDWKVISPFDPKGRAAYKQGFEELLKANPDTRILYGVFGDYNAIPDEHSFRVSDHAAYGHTREEGMKEILGIMKEVAGDRDILEVAWLWHAFFGRDKEEAAFMKELAQLGYGALYNEAGNSDCWIIKYDNFNATSLAIDPKTGRTPFGPQYLPIVSLGGACESVNPVIGFPLPHVAEHKAHRLEAAHVRNFATWWAGYEGWVYQPNNEVVSEIIWNPDACDDTNQEPFDPETGDPLLRHIAERDFGKDLAPGVLDFWRLFDKAVVTHVPLYQKPATLPPPDTDGLHIYDWYQRMGIFTEAIFGAPYPMALTPADLAARKEVTDAHDKSWMHDPHALANYAAVLKNLDAAVAKIDALCARPAATDVARRLKDMRDWSDLYRHLLTCQYNFMRAVTVMKKHAGEPLDSQALRAELSPVARDEIANDESLMALLPNFAPNFNIRSNMEMVWENVGSVEEETAVLRQKIAGTQIWLSGARSISLGKPAKASSVEMAGKTADKATDGDGITRWSSKYADNQWIYVDLGSVQPIGTVVLHWNPAYAKTYDLQVSSDPGEPTNWTTVCHVTRGHGQTEVLPVPAGTTGRYVRMDGLTRGTGWGFSINEFEVFPPATASAAR